VSERQAPRITMHLWYHVCSKLRHDFRSLLLSVKQDRVIRLLPQRVRIVEIGLDDAVMQIHATAVGARTAAGVEGVLATGVGDLEFTDVESINVDGKSEGLTAAMSFEVGGGGISIESVFRFLPFGAGSRGGDRLYVTVLVTTERTLTGFGHALRGASKKRLVALSQFQSAGEKGEYMPPVLMPLRAVRGDGPQVEGEKAGECGMRSRRKAVGFLRPYGVGGKELEGDLRLSLRLDDRLEEVDVFEIMECRVLVDSSDIDLWSALGGGLARTGVKPLRKSVYATGGVIGVFRPANSCLTTAETHEIGVSTISEGKDADFGVWRGGRTGLVAAGIVLSTTRESSFEAYVSMLNERGSKLVEA